MIARLKNYARHLRRTRFIDPGDYRKSVLLAGSPRSGTTWIQELLNYRNEYRMMFEPFHARYVELVKDWNYRQYLREDETDEKYLIPARRILSGQIKHPWIDKMNRRLLVRRRLIKDVRANLFLKWIQSRFPEVPIILLLRHPCAVTSSRISLNFETHLDSFLEQPLLMQNRLGPFREQIEAVDNEFDAHLFMWCVENYVPLNQFAPSQVHLCFYEQLCTDPDHEAHRLLSYLGETPDRLTAQAIDKPSRMSRQDSAVVSGDNRISAWRKRVSPAQLGRAVEVLHLFGLDQVYADQDMPLLEPDEALARFTRRPARDGGRP